jgi:hypothetical protein
VTAWPGGEMASDTAGPGRLRASHADREQVIGVLKTAFVQGRLAKDEFDAQVGLTFASRTYADLAAVTADLPAWLFGAQPPRKPARAKAQPPASTDIKPGVVADNARARRPSLRASSIRRLGRTALAGNSR